MKSAVSFFMKLMTGNNCKDEDKNGLGKIGYDIWTVSLSLSLSPTLSCHIFSTPSQRCYSGLHALGIDLATLVYIMYIHICICGLRGYKDSLSYIRSCLGLTNGRYSLSIIWWCLWRTVCGDSHMFDRCGRLLSTRLVFSFSVPSLIPRVSVYLTVNT